MGDVARRAQKRAAKEQQDVAPRPFYEVRHEYEESFRAYQQAANSLYSAVVSITSIVSSGGDPGKAIEALKPYADAFFKAAYHQEAKP